MNSRPTIGISCAKTHGFSPVRIRWVVLLLHFQPTVNLSAESAPGNSSSLKLSKHQIEEQNRKKPESAPYRSRKTGVIRISSRWEARNRALEGERQHLEHQRQAQRELPNRSPASHGTEQKSAFRPSKSANRLFRKCSVAKGLKIAASKRCHAKAINHPILPQTLSP